MTLPSLDSCTDQQSHVAYVHRDRIRRPFHAAYGRKWRLRRVQQLTAMILIALSPRTNPCR